MKERNSIILYFIGFNLLLLFVFLMPEPPGTYWDLGGETISIFWWIWTVLQIFYPIILLLEVILIFFLIWPSKSKLLISHKPLGEKL